VTGARGVLVDRDGTLIRDVGYLSRREQIELLPRVAEALRLLSHEGLKIIVVTNQSAIARGFLTESELRQIHGEVERELAREGAHWDGIYYCPHHPCEGEAPYRVSCQCRKPNPGLAQLAAAEFHLDLSHSYVVGDQPSDMELAAKIGAQGIRIDPQRAEKSGSRVVEVGDLWEAAQWIIQDLRKKNQRPEKISWT